MPNVPWDRYTMPDEQSAKELVRRAGDLLGKKLEMKETPFGTFEIKMSEADVERVSWIALDILLPGSDVYKKSAEKAIDDVIGSCFPKDNR